MKKSFIFFSLGILLTGVSLFGRWGLTSCMAEEPVNPVSITVTKEVPLFTNDNTPSVGLMVTPNANFEIKFNDLVLGSGVGTGEEELLTISQLADGYYNLGVVATLDQDTASTFLRGFTVDTIAPTIDIGPDILTNKKTALSASASDSSGLNIVLWEQLSGPGDIFFDNSADLQTEFEADTDGAYVLKLTAIDNAGNHSFQTMNVVWDTSPPEISINREPDKDLYSDPYAITIDYSDDCFTKQFKIDDGDWQEYFGVITVDTEGTHTVYVRATDEAGNEVAASTSFTLDLTSPEVVALLDPNVQNHNDSYTLTIDFGDSVLKQYSIDDGEWLDYTEPIVISDEGFHIVYVVGTDSAGNQNIQILNFSIDKTAPQITISTTPDQNIYNNNYLIDINFGDSVIKEYKIDQGDWMTYEESFIISSEGEHIILARGTDLAGNITTTEELRLKIDRSVPEILIQINPDQDLSNSDFVIDINFINAAVKEYKIDSEDWKSYDGPITIFKEGTHRITARAVSEAGTEVLSDEMMITIDKTIPTVSNLEFDLEVNPENEKNFLIKGKSESESIVECEVEEKIYHAVCDQNGDFLFDLNLSGMKDGTVIIKILVKDAAGNQSEQLIESIIKKTSVPDADEDKDKDDCEEPVAAVKTAAPSSPAPTNIVTAPQTLPKTGVDTSWLGIIGLLAGLFTCGVVRKFNFSK